MTLKELIQNYRQKHNISQRQFATACGLSNGYISMLERGFNPKTKEPIIPALSSLKKLADGMGMTVDELLSTAEDMPVSLSVSESTDYSATQESKNQKELEPAEILELKGIYNRLNDEGRKRLMSHARYLTTETDCIIASPIKSKIG